MAIDEALRSQQHPGIVLRPGPTGRRAALVDGPDVWEIIAALEAVRDEHPQAGPAAIIRELGRVTGLTAAQQGVALRYYAAYPDEIDERIRRNRETADREERLWEAQQPAHRRKP